MKKFIIAALLTATYSIAFAAGEAITVYKDKNCGCCEGWIAHLREAGFKVKAVNSDDMSSIKKRFGVPESMMSCHTAVIDKSGQVIEGHVPAKAVNKLIARPAVKGVAVPGMPTNAPGMGKQDGSLITYDFAGRSFSMD
ncbi:MULTISPECIES: DUF411 domain-containing protein [Oxalobacteraceae]|uniref:DUF411 domain-containing protein n=1 Tax=Oxalobacteraceae TaxID=75682 RepID=UPI0010A2E812|nr:MULTISPECIES: DUF411 domain-containing protein [Oxalobacteraceae]